MYHYYVFGLHIASSIHFPEMALREGPPDVCIQYGQTPRDLVNPKISGVRYQAGPGEFLLQVDHVARYYVTNGNNIVIEPLEQANDQEVLLFLMGSAMGALLHQRKILPLHGSAIEVNGESIIFLGPSGIGKSTIAACFLKHGYGFLADDVCAVTVNDGRGYVIPGFPKLKLWADSLQQIKIKTKNLQSVRGDRNIEKYFLPVDSINDSPVPVRMIFILERTNTQKIDVLPIKGMQKIDAVMANTYRLPFLEGLGCKKTHFMQCAAIAGKTKVNCVMRPKKPFSPDKLMHILDKEF